MAKRRPPLRETCRPKALPGELLLRAAQTARQINPANAPNLDAACTPEHKNCSGLAKFCSESAPEYAFWAG